MELPKSFNDLTVRQYQDASIIFNDKEYDEFFGDLTPHIRLIALFSGLTEDEVLEQCDKKELAKRYASLSFLNDQKSLDSLPFKKIIVANGKVYCALGMQDFKSGQLLTLKKLEEHPNQAEVLNQMLALIYSPINWLGKPKKYKASRHVKISEDMKHANLGDVYGALVFKKKVLETLNPIIQMFLKQETTTIQEIMPEVMKWAKENPQILKEAGLTIS